MTTAFAPTHEIVFTPVTGAPRTILVALTDEGAAYTREEWESETAADWECRDGAWLCQGQVTPGGANGTVEVRPVSDIPTPANAELDELRAGCVALDQRDALTVGASTWAIYYAGGQRGQMSEWPNGRGAAMFGADSEWGDWDGDVLVTDDGARYGRDGSVVEAHD